MTDTSHNKKAKKSTSEAAKGKKRDRNASEGRLLKAAQDVFSKYGFKASTTRMIAKKAGVNESLIGRYFEGKMGLLLAIIENHLQSDEFHEKLSYPAQSNVEDELLGYAKFKFEKECRKDFDFFKIVISQALVDAKFLKRIREAMPAHKFVELESRLKALQQAGKVKKDVNVSEVFRDLDVFMFGNMMMNRVLLNTDITGAQQMLESFIRRYSRMIST